MHYEIMCISGPHSGELTGHFGDLAAAKKEAERLCNENNRTVHFAVVKIEQVWVTSTLDEAVAADAASRDMPAHWITDEISGDRG